MSIVCELCDSDPMKAADRGAYLKRVNPTGVTGIWQCSPSCETKDGNQDTALLRALEDSLES